jgi:hypothetical protein
MAREGGRKVLGSKDVLAPAFGVMIGRGRAPGRGGGLRRRRATCESGRPRMG